MNTYMIFSIITIYTAFRDQSMIFFFIYKLPLHKEMDDILCRVHLIHKT